MHVEVMVQGSGAQKLKWNSALDAPCKITITSLLCAFFHRFVCNCIQINAKYHITTELFRMFFIICFGLWASEQFSRSLKS